MFLLHCLRNFILVKDYTNRTRTKSNAHQDRISTTELRIADRPVFGGGRAVQGAAESRRSS